MLFLFPPLVLLQRVCCEWRRSCLPKSWKFDLASTLRYSRLRYLNLKFAWCSRMLNDAEQFYPSSVFLVHHENIVSRSDCDGTSFFSKVLLVSFWSLLNVIPAVHTDDYKATKALKPRVTSTFNFLPYKWEKISVSNLWGCEEEEMLYVSRLPAAQHHFVSISRYLKSSRRHDAMMMWWSRSKCKGKSRLDLNWNVLWVIDKDKMQSCIKRKFPFSMNQLKWRTCHPSIILLLESVDLNRWFHLADENKAQLGL